MKQMSSATKYFIVEIVNKIEWSNQSYKKLPSDSQFFDPVFYVAFDSWILRAEMARQGVPFVK